MASSKTLDLLVKVRSGDEQAKEQVDWYGLLFIDSRIAIMIRKICFKLVALD